VQYRIKLWSKQEGQVAYPYGPTAQAGDARFAYPYGLLFHAIKTKTEFNFKLTRRWLQACDKIIGHFFGVRK